VTYRYGSEHLETIIKEVSELWRANWEETERYHREIPFNPDYQQYFRLDHEGKFRLYTVRDNGRLMGHIGFVVAPHRHTQTLVAGEEFFYLRPEARRGWVAAKLLRFAFACLRWEIPKISEIKIVNKHLTADTGKLLERLGMKCVAKLYNIVL
jgi:GNAT superfamily N-acetyltransferase